MIEAIPPATIDGFVTDTFVPVMCCSRSRSTPAAPRPSWPLLLRPKVYTRPFLSASAFSSAVEVSSAGIVLLPITVNAPPVPIVSALMWSVTIVGTAPSEDVSPVASATFMYSGMSIQWSPERFVQSPSLPFCALPQPRTLWSSSIARACTVPVARSMM